MMNNFTNFNRGAMMGNNIRGHMGGMQGGRGGMNNMMPMGGMGMGNMGMNPMMAGMGMPGRCQMLVNTTFQAYTLQASKAINLDLACSTKEAVPISAVTGISLEQSDSDKTDQDLDFHAAGPDCDGSDATRSNIMLRL